MCKLGKLKLISFRPFFSSSLSPSCLFCLNHSLAPSTHVSEHSFWIPVQRQVWLQHRAAHFKQATGHRGERSGHGLPPHCWSSADRQLHWTGLHNRRHGHLSGTVCQKLSALCIQKLYPAGCFLFLLITYYPYAANCDIRWRQMIVSAY